MAGDHNRYARMHDTILPTSGQVDYVPGVGFMKGWGGGESGAGLQGWAPGAKFLNTATGLSVENMGSAVAANWAQAEAAGDSVPITFGASADVAMMWDGDNFSVLPLTDNAGQFQIGDGTTDMDLKIFMGSTAAHVLFDNSEQLVTYTGTKLRIGTAAGTGPSCVGTDPDQVFQAHGVMASLATAAAYAAAYNTFTVTADQSNNVSVFGTWSELYLTGDLTLTGSSNYAAHWALLEMADAGGALTGPAGIAWMAAVCASIIAPDGLVNDAVLAGVIADSNLTNGYTENGTTAGFLVRKGASNLAWPYGLYLTASATATGIYLGTCTTGINLTGTIGTGINFTSTTVTTGILFANGFAGRAIKVGSLSSDTPGSGAKLDATTTRAVEVNADDNNTARAVGTTNRAIYGRLMIYADNACEDWGLHGLSKVSSVAKTGNVSAGVVGAFESTGECSTASGQGNTYCAGVMGRVGTGGTFTIGAGTKVACLLAFGNNANANAFTNAGYVGVCVALTDIGTAEVLDVGLDIEASSCVTGIEINTVSGTAIDFPSGSTYGKALAYGTFGTPVAFGDDEPFEIHGRLDANAKVKPLMRVRCSTPDGVAMTTGEVHAIQAQGYNTSTSDAAVIEALQAHVGIKADSEVIADIEGEEPNMRAAWFKIEDLGNDLTLTGTACVLNLGIQWNAGTVLTGNCDWIKLVKKGSLTEPADAFVRVYDGAGGGWATNLLDIPASAPWSATNATGDAGKLAVKLGGATKYINLYNS
jgi:hypothetical protein